MRSLRRCLALLPGMDWLASWGRHYSFPLVLLCPLAAGPCVRWWTALPNPLRKVLSGRLIALKGVGAAIHSRSPPAPTPLRLLFCFFVPAAGDYTTLYVQYSAFAVTQIAYRYHCRGLWPLAERRRIIGEKESWSFSDVIHHKKGNAITACAERYVN